MDKTALLPFKPLEQYFHMVLTSFYWSIHLFQRNQRFQAIEFVDWLVPEKPNIFQINLS